MPLSAPPSAPPPVRPTFFLLLLRPAREPLFLSRSPEHENGPMTTATTSHAKSHSTQDFPSDGQWQRACRGSATRNARVNCPSVVYGNREPADVSPPSLAHDEQYNVCNLPSPLETSRCDDASRAVRAQPRVLLRPFLFIHVMQALV